MMVYCGLLDGYVNFWDKDEFVIFGGVFKGYKLVVLCLVMVGSLVFSGFVDMNICVWKRINDDSNYIDNRNYICLLILMGYNGLVKCLVVEVDREIKIFDGRWILYSGSLDKFVKMWRVFE